MTVNDKVEQQPGNERYACTTFGAPYTLALVVKRTYVVDAVGECWLDSEQLPICDDVVDYEKVESPQVAIPQWDNDLFSLKSMTDVVVQGSAQTYGRELSETAVELKFAGIQRKIKVFGDRIIYWSGGRPLFTQPEPFVSMPIRYDRAYGGLDSVALQRHGDAVAKQFSGVRPEWQLETTSPFHYPRNPSGKGFAVSADRETLEGLSVPNLEWFNDPLDPERLAVGNVKDWMSGALPAAFDWYDQANFPRIGYLGQFMEYNLPESGIPEVEMGYAAVDLMAEHSIFTAKMHNFFFHGATPGLSVKKLSPTETFILTNLSPVQPQFTLRLPGEIPHVKVKLPKRKTVKMQPFLSSVILQPEDNRIVTVWSCRAEIDRPYVDPEFPYLPYDLIWKGR